MVDHRLEQREVSALVRLRRWEFSGPYVGRQTAHEGIEVAWCRSGMAEYTIGRRRVVLLPGQAIVVPAMVEHVTQPVPGTEAASLLLDAAALDAAADTMGARLDAPRLLAGDGDRPSALTLLGGLLEREACADRKGRGLAVEALTDAVVIEVLRAGQAEEAPEPSGPPRGDPRVKRALDLVHTRYADPLSIDDMARAAHMSRYHFSRIFRQETGKTPYRYLLDVRLAHAAEILRARKCAVTEAALSVGWNDLGRFGRMFREVHGVAPSEYLRGQ